ncbi:Actin-binding LIM protein 1 [Nymphon striatum]|nr:Actin-binding LIM protein 1 [Nymphon striatum]
MIAKEISTNCGFPISMDKFKILAPSNNETDLRILGRKVNCIRCKKSCSGNVLKVQDKYFHVDCFKCKECSVSLSQGGFFCKDNEYFCAKDYQKHFGTKCAQCGKYVEGEVVTALGNTYHQKCFVCARCRQPFPTGQKVTFTGKEILCSKCIQIPVVASQTPDQSPCDSSITCAGCSDLLQEGQSLVALDKNWHIWCFKCNKCSSVLHGEFMSKDGIPYCEKDYQSLFGVKCAHCDRFISGKVLQAGDAIWHPRCGPGPNGQIDTPQIIESPPFRNSNSSLSSSRSASPYDVNRKYIRDDRESPIGFLDDPSRVYTYSYLTPEPTLGYLKRPLEPKAPKSPMFHRPPDGKRSTLPKIVQSKQGMKALVNTLQYHVPRPKSPHMNNEEPIGLAHYPDAHPPRPNEPSRIERDDFPAPPFPYTDPERRRRLSGSSKDVDISDEEDEFIEEDDGEKIEDDPRLKKEEQELSKIATGIGKVFLQDVKERERLRTWKLKHVDPRNASRTPSASKEPQYRLRYDNPINASPSRSMERPRPWEEDENDHRYRSSTGRSVGTIPFYNVVSSLRAVPKPGYGLTPKSATLPASGRNGGSVGFLDRDLSLGDLQTQNSADYSSGKSDGQLHVSYVQFMFYYYIAISIFPIDALYIFSLPDTLNDSDKHVNHSGSCLRSVTYSDGHGGPRHYSSYIPHIRRSLPNMTQMPSEPPKIYPLHLLLTSNYRLPNDVDRNLLERHLSDEEFEMVFNMNRVDFYRLPEWRRNDMKRRAKMF